MKPLYIKKIAALFILICFLFQNIPVQAQLAPDPSQFTSIDIPSAATGQKQLSPEEETEVKNLLKLPTQYTLEIMFLMKNLYYKVVAEEEKKGQDAIIEMLKKRKDSENIEFEVEGVGKAEPLILNVGYKMKPIVITKVRHNGLKLSMLWIDIHQMDLKSLEEFDSYDRTGLLKLYEPFKGLPPEEIREQIEYQRALVRAFRKLCARILLAEWNPQLEYSPLAEFSSQEKPQEPVPEGVEKKVDEALNVPLKSLESKSWFRKIKLNAINLWVDLAQQEKLERARSQGNDSVILILYNSKTGQIENRVDVNKKPYTTFTFWKDYWKAIWEAPAYRQDVWHENKGLEKLKVIFTGDYLMGLTFGFALGSLSLFVSSTLPASLPHGLTALTVAKISFGWSLFFGVFSKTWQNFAYRGNDFVRFLKNWSTGIGQSYHFNLVSDQSLALIKPDGQFDMSAIKTHTDILINQSIKSTSKTSLQEKYRFRNKVGEADGTIKIPYFKIIAPWKNNVGFMQFEVTETRFDMLKYVRKTIELFRLDPYHLRGWEQHFVFNVPDIKLRLPWLVAEAKESETGVVRKFAWDTGIPRTNFEGQKPQLISTPVGLLSRFGYTVAGLPLGHILYALLGPLGEVQQIRYKQAYAEQIVEIYGADHPLSRRVQALAQSEREKWDNLIYYKIPKQPLRAFGRIFMNKTDENKPEDYYQFKMPFIPRFIAYYIHVTPNIVKAGIEIARWTAQQIAYKTFNAYESLHKEVEATKTRKPPKSPKSQNSAAAFNCEMLFQ